MLIHLKLKIMRWAGRVAHIGRRRSPYRVLVEKPEGRRSPGRPRSRWKNNIKTVIQESEWEGAWTGLTWFRIVTAGGLL
jgi:hypothetical protein